MKFLSLLSALTLGGSFVSARSPQHVNKKLPNLQRRGSATASADIHEYKPRKASPTSRYLTEKTEKYVVNGTNIPDVDFDIGESYAGLIPTSNETNPGELYFWFFPSSNPKAEKEITIWLNGGPGCSSLEGFLQENGPFLWQYGTYKPTANTYSWVNLTNMVWVEQPVGTGFTQGTPVATNEEEVAAHFLGFFKNFVDTFAMEGFTVYITGESYAGYYVPYIADAMFNKKDKTYYNISSIQINDPSLTYDVIQEQIPAVPFVDFWGPLIDLNASYLEQIHKTAEQCGYTQYLDQYLVFPPKGILPTPPNADNSNAACDLWDSIYAAALEINPCFDIYQVATTCPLLWDVLGFPGSIPYQSPGSQIYFNRTDVQKAINAPVGTNWEECVLDVLTTDTSPASALSILPSVIERTERTIIGHGLLDFILMYNGTLLAVQNMTWAGAQGFSEPPNKNFFVPYHTDYNLGSLAGAGVMGQYHTERGLTVCTVDLSGHMIPQYAPSASYRQLEFLLGRIENLGVEGSFTTQ